MNLVLQSAPEIGNQYGVIVNKVEPASLEFLHSDSEHHLKIETTLGERLSHECKPRHDRVIYIPRIEELTKPKPFAGKLFWKTPKEFDQVSELIDSLPAVSLKALQTIPHEGHLDLLRRWEYDEDTDRGCEEIEKTAKELKENNWFWLHASSLGGTALAGLVVMEFPPAWPVLFGPYMLASIREYVNQSTRPSADALVNEYRKERKRDAPAVH